MGIRLPTILRVKSILYGSILPASKVASSVVDCPKRYLAVYAGETEKKRFLVPISCVNQALFRDLLQKAEEEFGFIHPMGGLTFPCREDTFLNLTSQLNGL